MKQEPCPLVSVNILSFNRKAELRNTLIMVYEQNYKNIEVIVVDNSSSDGSQKMVEAEFPNVILVKLEKNIGIAGWNKGFEIAKGEFILVLDDDSYPDKTTINSGIEFLMKNSNVGVIALDVYNNSTQCYETKEFENGTVTSFIGCGAIIKSDVLKKTGGYSNLIFLYSHEIEFSMRLLNIGYEILFIKGLLVFHNFNQLNRRIRKNSIDNRRLFHELKNRLVILFLHFPIYRIIFRSIRIILGHYFYYFFKGGLKYVFKATNSFLCELPEMLKVRVVLAKEVQRKYGFGSFAGGFFAK